VVIAMLYTSIDIGITRGHYYWVLDIGCLSWYRSNPNVNTQNASSSLAHVTDQHLSSTFRTHTTQQRLLFILDSYTSG